MLSDVLLFGTLVIVNFGIILLLLQLGKEYLFGYAMLTGGFLIMLAPVNIEMFGFPFALIEIMYASFFLITDILTELYGKKEARKTLHFALFGLIIGLIITKIGLRISPSEFDLGNAHLTIVSEMFTPVALMAVALAFFFEQSIDIFNFDLIKKWTNGKWLWVRNVVSTSITQILDAFIFYPIFFYPILGSEVWKLMVAAIAFKLIIVLLDTPFMYLAKYLHSPKPLQIQ